MPTATRSGALEPLLGVYRGFSAVLLLFFSNAGMVFNPVLSRDIYTAPPSVCSWSICGGRGPAGCQEGSGAAASTTLPAAGRPGLPPPGCRGVRGALHPHRRTLRTPVLGITSNLIFSQWEHIFANPMATAAAIDRVVHHSVILEFDAPATAREWPNDGVSNRMRTGKSS